MTYNVTWMLSLATVGLTYFVTIPHSRPVQARKRISKWVTRLLGLVPHRADRLLSILSEVDGRTRGSNRRWHRLLGERRSMYLAIRGCHGLFSHLQFAIRSNDKKRVRLNSAVRQELTDWLTLARSVASRSTHLHEVFHGPVSFVGTHDASGSGMGAYVFPRRAPARALHGGGSFLFHSRRGL